MPNFLRLTSALALLLSLTACGGGGGDSGTPTNLARGNSLVSEVFTSANPEGEAASWSTAGPIDLGNPFFRSAMNGRSCATCHSPHDGWSLTPASLAQRFATTNGNDPVFLPHDGANSPLANVGSLAERNAAYSMLLSKAVFRMGMPIPANAEFELAAVDDPYGFASATELSLFRRPLPSANLRFVTSVMWDGRETAIDPASPLCVSFTATCYASTHDSLLKQALTASKTHQQMANGFSAAELEQIVRFESSLFSAQKTGRLTGDLASDGANGGTNALAQADFWFGMNNFESGDYRTGAPFSTRVFSAYDAWSNASPSASVDADQADARRAVARGQELFNNRVVPGMSASSIQRTCSGCHGTTNVGSSSTPLLVNIGSSDASRRTSDLPLYTLRNRQTGQTLQTTDPGAAMVSGRWADIGKFKVPVLRGLAARAPYFHDGGAASLRDVVLFYNDRFQMNLSQQEISDLAAFLAAL